MELNDIKSHWCNQIQLNQMESDWMSSNNIDMNINMYIKNRMKFNEIEGNEIEWDERLDVKCYGLICVCVCEMCVCVCVCVVQRVLRIAACWCHRSDCDWASTTSATPRSRWLSSRGPPARRSSTRNTISSPTSTTWRWCGWRRPWISSPTSPPFAFRRSRTSTWSAWTPPSPDGAVSPKVALCPPNSNRFVLTRQFSTEIVEPPTGVSTDGAGRRPH